MAASHSTVCDVHCHTQYPSIHEHFHTRFYLQRICPKISRMFLFGFGFHWIHTKGELADSTEAPIFVAAPHSSMLDMFVIGVYHIPTVVARASTRRTPFFGCELFSLSLISPLTLSPPLLLPSFPPLLSFFPPSLPSSPSSLLPSPPLLLPSFPHFLSPSPQFCSHLYPPLLLLLCIFFSLFPPTFYLPGVITRTLRTIYVSREDSSSRMKAVQEIRRRVQSRGEWPKVLIFPEGTTTHTQQAVFLELAVLADQLCDMHMSVCLSLH